ncbi:MAG: hydroxyacid dehydrogenase [Chloroflexi bacterium]|nr:hydroxyacid dehydrogenase [Chloroflexota bacterium]
MPKPKILLDPHSRKSEWLFAPEEWQRLTDLAEIIWGKDDPIPPESFASVAAELTAIVTCGWRFGPLDALPRLRAILEVGGSHPSPRLLDYTACFQRGIRVLSCAPAFGPVVAEMALGLAIAAGRGIVEGDRLMRSGEERYSRAGNQDAFTLYGKRVGFIGYGGLAHSLQPLLAPFGCEFLAYDPWLPASYIQRQGVTPIGLDTLLSTCRVIFVLAVPSQENRGLIDRRRLELIQPDATFLLISRAYLVDFDALVELVNQGRFRVAIDVYPDEPVPPDHPVRRSHNTILSSHRAGHVPEDFRAIGRMVVDDLEAILHGLPPAEMQSAQPELVGRLR